MNLTVGVTPVALPEGNEATPVIQNLGPGIVYFDSDATVTVATGIRLGVGSAYEFPRDLGLGGGKLYLVSTLAATDVRYLAVG